MTLIGSRAFPRVAYLGASAGLGRVYDLAILLAARMTRTRVVIHHHSYRYVNKPDLLESAVVLTAGVDAVHILLCEHMRRRFCDQYAVDRRRTRVLSSAMLAEPEIRAMGGNARSQVGAVGYLGRLTAEKGIWDFLAVIAALRARGSKLLAHIAGPVDDPVIAAAVAQFVAADPGTRYWGAIYRADKVRLLDGIDVLIFPSRYRHEAEPLVVYEALAAGAPVVTTGVGCLRGLQPASGVFVVQDDTEFSTKAADIILGWLRDSATYAAASADARQYFVNQREHADRKAAAFLARLAGGDL
jgi:glycosyltransferase involved in cell wall biosynthesis